MTTRLLPNGFCHCGCGTEIGIGRFFAQGHDKTAEAAFLAVHHQGTVAQMLADHGYGPEKSITQAAVDAGVWENCPRGCGYVGAPASITNHVNRHHKEG